jgi:manganese-dependent inorganic pyrophosphatase
VARPYKALKSGIATENSNANGRHMIKVFGHKAPDTDSTGSPIIWAWYLSEVQGTPARPVLLGEPSTEAAFVLDRWKLDKPEIVTDVEAGDPVVIVDTNNPAELPAEINQADIRAIIDHHKLVGGHRDQGTDRGHDPSAGLHRHDHARSDGRERRQDARSDQGCDAVVHPVRHAGIPQPDHHRSRPRTGRIAGQRSGRRRSPTMPPRCLPRSPTSRPFPMPNCCAWIPRNSMSAGKLRVSVLETTAPAQVLDRKDCADAAMAGVAAEDGADRGAAFRGRYPARAGDAAGAHDLVKTIAEKSFGVHREGDTVVLPGVMSRKKQIIPVLTV